MNLLKEYTIMKNVQQILAKIEKLTKIKPPICEDTKTMQILNMRIPTKHYVQALMQATIGH